MSFLDLDAPTIFQQLRSSPSLKRRNDVRKGDFSPPKSPPTKTMKSPSILPNPAIKASLPLRRKARDNIPPPLQIVLPSYSSHTLNLPPTTAPPGFEPLPPFVAPSTARECDTPDSPTSLHSPSLWLNPTGLVEPVGPTMSAGSHVSCHWVVDDAESPFGLISPVASPPSIPPAFPSSAFDSDDDSDVEQDAAKLGSMRGKMRAFVWGSSGKRHKKAVKVKDEKKLRYQRNTDSSIKMSLSKTVAPLSTSLRIYANQPPPTLSTFSDGNSVEFVDHTDARNARRPSLVESLLLCGNMITPTDSDPDYSPRSSTSSYHSCIQPYLHNSVPTSPSTSTSHSTSPSHQFTSILADETHEVEYRASTLAGVDSLVDFDLDLFPMLAGDNSTDNLHSCDDLFHASVSDDADSSSSIHEDDHDGRFAIAIAL